MTRRDEAKYWTEGSYDDWLAEMAGARDKQQIGRFILRFLIVTLGKWFLAMDKLSALS